MKLITAFLGTVLCAGLMFAQAPGQGRMRGGPGGPGGPGGAMDSARGVEMRVQMLTRSLELTADQVAQATTIFTNAANSSQTIRTALAQHRAALRDAIKTNNIATIDQVSNAIGIASGQMTAIDAKAEASFYAVLTADQKAKYDQRGGGFGFGGGGSGPMGPRPPRE